jgi:hypothetical protein
MLAADSAICLAQWPRLASPTGTPFADLLGVAKMPTSLVLMPLQPYDRMVLKAEEPRSHLQPHGQTHGSR